MSRRNNPRATRGNKPVHNAEQLQKDNRIYAKLFGQDLDDDEEYQLKQAKQNERKERTLRNLKKYSYARGHTYCYDLEIFPRLEQHPSYAIDENNIFGSTYPQQERLYKGSRLGSLINRNYFGLPYTENAEKSSNEGKTKNVCHYYLFENQDKKYHLDRIIVTYKRVLKNLVKIMRSGKIHEFSVFKKDPEIYQILSSESQISSQIEALQKKIRILQQRKSANVYHWYYEDSLFFHHSLNQILHDKVNELRNDVNYESIYISAYTNYYLLQMIVGKDIEAYNNFLDTALVYNNSRQMVFSQGVYNKIKNQYAQRIMFPFNEGPFVLFPTKIFYFGSNKTLQIANTILASKIQTQNQANYYTAKFAWRKLFKVQLQSNKLQKLKPQQIAALSKKLIEQAEYFYKQPIQNIQQWPDLDNLLNTNELQDEGNSPIQLITQGQSIQLNSKQLIIVFLYDYICKSLQQFLPFIQRFGVEVLQVIASEQFEKYIHGFVKAICKPITGILRSSMEFLCSLIPKIDSIPQSLKFEFQYIPEKNIGILWAKQLDEDWQTQREDDDGDEEEHEDEDEDEDEHEHEHEEEDGDQMINQNSQNSQENNQGFPRKILKEE